MKFFTLIFLSVLTSTNLLAQKLPFQGQLIQDGAPFTGSVEITFSIPDGAGGELWSEIQPVEVVDGLYSVVLGSVNPLPGDLFDEADERQLGISVNATALSPVTIYAGIQRSKFSKTMTGTADSPAVLAEVNGAASNMAAVEGYAATEGDNYGVYGQGQGTGGKYNIGMYGVGLGAGNGELNNWDVEPNTFGSYNYGMYGVGRDNLNGNIGVYGRSLGTTGTDNIGVVGWSEVGAGAENKGVVGWAKGTGINKGVIGLATGGTENWAGWFEGDTRVMGELSTNSLVVGKNPEIEGISGAFVNSSTIYTAGIDGEINTMISNNWLNGGPEGANRGALLLWGDAATRTATGRDVIRGAFTVRDNGYGKDVAWLALSGPNSATGSPLPTENIAFVEAGAFAADGEGNSHIGKLMLRGTNSNNPLVDLRVDRWQDGTEHGFLTLKSSTGQEYHIGPNGGGVAGVGFGEKDWEEGLQGFYHMYGDTPEGKDNYRGGIEVGSDGQGNTWGTLNLHGPVFTDLNSPTHPRGFVNAFVGRDAIGQAPDEWSGQIQTWGHESPNIFIEGQNHADSDLGQINVFGNQPDGNGWWHAHASLSVGSDNGQQFGQLSLMGNNGKENLVLGAKSWETNGTNPGGRPFLRMRGNTPDLDMIWMDVSENAGVEFAALNFSSSDGISTRISSYDITVGDFFGTNTGVHINSGGGIDASGHISATSISETSDRTLKENITPLEHALSNTLKLRGVSYNWIDKTKTQKNQIGVIAQEVEEVYPEFVHTNEEGMKSVNYSQMVAVLIEAIKELNTQIETLKSENASLKTELVKATDNEKRITELEASMKTLIGLAQQQDKPAAESNIEIGRQE